LPFPLISAIISKTGKGGECHAANTDSCLLQGPVFGTTTGRRIVSSIFASSDIEIYPFQIAAASFALRSPHQKGAVLCDEAGIHEAVGEPVF